MVDEFTSDDEEFACDCIATKIHEALPGAPGRRAGFIPYESAYDTQEAARRRGYWIPGVPVKARITNVEKNTKFGLHLINAYLYTIELEHGPFKWSVVKQNKDFAILAARLMTHRAAERIRAPVRRAQEVLDDALESVGVDIIPDHRENCPYRSRPRTKVFTLTKEQNEINSKGTDSGQRVDDADSNGELSRDRGLNDSERSSRTRRAPLARMDTTVPEESQGSRRRTSTRTHHLPSLKFLPDSVGDPNERRATMEVWLQAVLHIPVNRNHHETAEFLEVSRFSFINELGGKYAEGFVKKRPGGTRVFIGCKQFCVRHCLRWSKRWLILKDTSVCYMDARTEQIRFVLLFDRDFEVSAGSEETEGLRSGLTISNQQHELTLKCATPLDAVKWKTAILESMNGVGRIWREPHPYGSTFPLRRTQSVQWFVDGRKYMEHAANMMELAREEIFIADWWLSPEIYLKRPLVEGNRWRLDELLRRKAEQGVRIFVLLYKEMEMALGLNSIYTKRTLQGLHKNIKVMRHPDHYLSSGTFFWAHHEKLVIVDQLIAFVGGVDLCYGRWDDPRHMLTDLGSVQYGTSHALSTNRDFSVLSGMRSLAAESVTLSPLGLEAHEEVPRQETVNNNPSSDGSQVNGTDEVDGSKSSSTVTRSKASAETSITTTRIWRVARRSTRSAQSVGKRPLATSTPSSDPHDRHTTTDVMIFERGIGYRRTVNGAIPNRQGSSHKSFFSVVKHSTMPRSRATTDAPPMEMVSMDAQRMEVHDALNRYKAYVESGKAFEDKRRAGRKSPPPQGHQSMLYRMTHNLRPTAKKRWKKVKEETGQYDLKWMELHNEDEKIKSLEMEGAAKLWLGKDYVNFIYKDFVELDMPFHDFIDRGCTPRMPWHDIHAVTYGSSARDLARHFIQRWNATKTEKSKDIKDYPFLLPKCYDTIKVPRVLSTMSETADVQVLRSVSNWSSLINHTEDSIQQAYLSLIANSRHCIYIENQFFVSAINSNEVNNEICRVLCDRIKRAYYENEVFRVYILLPLLPGFEGDVGAPGGSALQAVLHWTFLSLSRGPNSLIGNLKKLVPDPMKYIKVCSLRTWDILCGKLVTELIYIHCKCMIVDDKYTIIGSANINDRSQCGNRDSEVCIVVKDTEFVPSRMNGRAYEAGRFALSLRKHLMEEHLGMLPEQAARFGPRPASSIDLDDPIVDSFFFDTWGAIAKKNTRIYEEVFRVYPTDMVESFDELKAWQSQMPMSEYSPQLAEEQLRQLTGSLVEFPLNFLLKANLAPGLASKEGLVPTSVFT
uniref:Phospholipase n=3 Tax=Parascaris univalens TaxID=6257 RepID=A0A915B7M1_PARUN